MQRSVSPFRSVCVSGFLFLAMAGAGPAIAADYYVSKTGNDANIGSEASPWLTINKAARTLSAGDTVHIKSGTYHEKVTLRVQGNAAAGYITFRNHQNDTVIVDGTGFNLTTDWAGIIEILGKSYIRIQGLHVQNTQRGISIFVSGGTTGASHVQIVNNEVSNHEGNNAIMCQGDALSEVLIDSNDVHDCTTGGYEAIRVSGDTKRFIISNNRVYNNSNIGIDVVGWGPQPEYGVVRNNICYRNGLSASGAHGIYVDGGNYVTVENNVSYDNWGGISIGAEHPGITARHIIVRRNVVYQNWVRGIALGSCDTCGRPQDCAVVHNVCYDNNVQNSSSALVIRNYQGAHLIKNNVLHQTFGGNPYAYAVMYQATPSDPQMIMDYNCEFPANVMYYFQNLRYTSFSAWQAVTGQERHSFLADPRFVSAPTQEFLLTEGSPCIDTGDFLARAVSTGSGTELGVDDTIAFTDGYNGVFPGDVIRVGDQAPVGITLVDHANARLVLSEPRDWTAGDGVSLVYLGARPDIGAYEYGLTTTAGTLAGTVTDLETGAPLPGALLTTESGSTFSDETGGYALNLPTGNHEVLCALNGYTSQDKLVGILPGETVLLNWRLQSSTPRSTDITVSPSIYVQGKSPREHIRFGNLPAEATIRIFTLSGRSVAVLRHSATGTGGREDWDIRDMASGIYIYQIEGLPQRKQGKVAIVK